MARGGSKTEEIDERRCLVHGSGTSKHGMIRFVLSPDGEVVPDLAERLGGRGAWVSADRASLETAIAKKQFARAFKSDVKLAPNFIDNIEAMLSKRLISAIGLARKSGKAIAGADRVKESLQKGTARILLQAHDGSEREKRNIGSRDELDEAYQCLSGEELGMAFGKETVIHAALTSAGINNRVKHEADRLCGFRVLEASRDQKD